MPGKIADALKWLFDLVVDSVKNIASGIWNFFKDPIGSIVSAFDFVIDFLGGLIEGFMNMLKSLFIPDDGFIDKQFAKTKEILDHKINLSQYESALDSIAGANATEIPQSRGSLMFLGVDFSVLSNDFLKFLPTIRPYSDPILRGIMFITLLFYNINNVYKLIRGSGNAIDEGSDSN